MYFDLDGVDPWDEERDARKYSRAYPVVAHPPCSRWSQLANVNQALGRVKVGDDGGCFKSALSTVRTYGGVIEHPAHSSAWKEFCLAVPRSGEGWVSADWLGGWTCEVEQGHYGHSARKKTWLYVFGVGLHELPRLLWGKSDASGRVAAWKNRKPSAAAGRIPKHEALATPMLFRDALISIALTASPREVPE